MSKRLIFSSVVVLLAVAGAAIMGAREDRKTFVPTTEGASQPPIYSVAPMEVATPAVPTTSKAPKTDFETSASLNFASAKDIWKFSSDALNSKSESVVFEASLGAHECNGFHSSWNELSSYLAGGTGTKWSGPVSVERQVALDALRNQCAGFLVRDPREGKELARKLDGRLVELGNSLKNAQEQLAGDPTNVSNISTLIFSGSPAAQELGLRQLDSAWAANNNIKASDLRVKAMGIASMLATCELGRDCSLTSYSTQLRCAMYGQCLPSLFDDWRAGLTESQIADVSFDKALLVKAISTRDLGLLGIR